MVDDEDEADDNFLGCLATGLVGLSTLGVCWLFDFELFFLVVVVVVVVVEDADDFAERLLLAITMGLLCLPLSLSDAELELEDDVFLFGTLFLFLCMVGVKIKL